MDTNRRKFIAALGGTAGLVGALPILDRVYPWKGAGPWHPLTRALLDRLAPDKCQPSRRQVERVVRELAEANGYPDRPVIKWMDSPTDAFESLSRYGLAKLLDVPPASFWHGRLPIIGNAGATERSFELRCVVTELLGVDEFDRALMAPKLLAKAGSPRSGGSPEAFFHARTIAAQIGWLETLMPAAVAEALGCIERLLSSGISADSAWICHQSMVVEAWEHGLLATWETPDEMICVMRTANA